MRPNFHVNISDQFTICGCIRPSLEGSMNMDLFKEDDYVRKEISCGKTIRSAPYGSRIHRVISRIFQLPNILGSLNDDASLRFHISVGAKKTSHFFT